MSEIEELKKLAKGIILGQGNIFIKELLRKENIKIGTNKEEFLENILKAIDDGDLIREHFDDWLKEVEGWGEQHIYLYKIPEDIKNLEIWNNRDKINCDR